MSNCRIPGPICGSEDWPSLADGTLSLWLAPLPGPLHADPWRPLPWLVGALGGMPGAGALDFLFRMCLNPAMGLGDADYEKVARALGAEVAAIKAVAEVETSGKAFDDDGRPRILYERHYFHRLTRGRYSRRNPDISNPRQGGYGKFRDQYPKLERAYALDKSAALKSASWGRFQIMGANHAAAGFATVEEFVLAMTRSEAKHLEAFACFVKSNRTMLKALRGRDWAGFAAAYNGSNYRANAYDEKLKAAYARHAKAAGGADGVPP